MTQKYTGQQIRFHSDLVSAYESMEKPLSFNAWAKMIIAREVDKLERGCNNE